MASNDNRPVKSPSGGMIGELTLRIKLIMRLMGDKRVSPLLKLVPVGTLVYFVVPDIIPFVIDDAAVIGVGMTLFVELCPQYVVDEHMRALRAYTPPAGRTSSGQVPPQQQEDILEGEFREVDEIPTPSNNGSGQEEHEK